MAQQQLAVVENEPPSSSSDEAIYDALLGALSSTARGRAFLEEHARRVRAQDTAAALAALARIEAMLAKQQTPPVVASEAIEIREIDPDDAYVPFEFEALPDTEPRSPGEHREPGEASRASERRSLAEASGSALRIRAQAPRGPGSPDDDHPGFACAHPGYKTESAVREDLLAQVMALSPEERIALFS